MVSIAWPSLEGIETGKLAAARRQAHNAVHWLVRFANSYSEPNGGRDPTQLVWNGTEGVIETNPFLDDYSVELRVGPLEMQFRESGKPVPHTLDFEERTPAHVEAWVLVELLHRGIDRDRYSKSLPYHVNDLMTGDHEDFEPEAYRHELGVIDQCLRAGAQVLDELRRRNDTGIDADTALTCWAEPFQVGYEIALPPGSGAESVRVGISPGDGVRHQPYFFAGTSQQARTASFAAGSVLSVDDIVKRNMDIDAVVAELGGFIQALRRKLAG